MCCFSELEMCGRITTMKLILAFILGFILQFIRGKLASNYLSYIQASQANFRTIIKVSGYQYQWLAGGYDLEIGHFRSG